MSYTVSGMPKQGSRLERVKKRVATLTPIVFLTVVLVVAVDFALTWLRILPPRVNPGHPTLGWVAAEPTGAFVRERCVEYDAGVLREFSRDPNGLRRDSLPSPDGGSPILILVGGDSHTELCAANGDTHFGVTEAGLRADSLNVAVGAFGTGRYSPLQAYLAVETFLRQEEARVFVLNLYTGNDFHDLLRVDDRPHFVQAEDGYRIAPPIWYAYDDPDALPQSRVVGLAREIGRRLGVRDALFRVRFLRAVAAEQGEGFGTVVRYLRDIRSASSDELGYPQAFTAQFLNQQLFFHHFPDAEAESLRRVEALLKLVRNRHPGLLLVLSPLPSFQLVTAGRPDSILQRVSARLPVSYSVGAEMEDRLYDSLGTIAARTGWAFVDNRQALYAAQDQRLFNRFDFHLEPAASRVIGEAQVTVIRTGLDSLAASAGRATDVNP